MVKTGIWVEERKKAQRAEGGPDSRTEDGNWHVTGKSGNRRAGILLQVCLQLVLSGINMGRSRLDARNGLARVLTRGYSAAISSNVVSNAIVSMLTGIIGNENSATARNPSHSTPPAH